jgi:hypothetical protein
MNCSHCGALLHDSDRFCWKCGLHVQDADPGETDENTASPGTSGEETTTSKQEPGHAQTSRVPAEETPDVRKPNSGLEQTEGGGSSTEPTGSESRVYHPHRDNSQTTHAAGEWEPNFFDRREKELPESKPAAVLSGAEQSKAAFGPRAIMEEKEEFVWHGRRSLLEFLDQWCLVALAWVLGSLTLIFRLPLSNLFKTSQPLWYTIWGYVALALFLIGGIILLLIFYYVLGSYYRLTTQRFIRQRGFIARKIDYCELMRVRDMGVNQSFLDRIFDVGDLQILSSERLVPDIKVYGIRHPYRMLEEIRRRVMHSRAVRGVGILEVDK